MKGMTQKGIYGFRRFYEYTEPTQIKELKKRVIQLERQVKELKKENRTLREETGNSIRENSVLVFSSKILNENNCTDEP